MFYRLITHTKPLKLRLPGFRNLDRETELITRGQRVDITDVGAFTNVDNDN